MHLNQAFRILGPAVRIYQLNIENITNSKSDYLARLMADEKIEIILVQETRILTLEFLVCKG